MSEPYRIILSCEHGGNRVPAPYRELFAGEQELLTSHRGYDIGILPLARRLARELSAPLHAAETSRLLVDLNRSRHSPTLFSEISRRLSPAERETILRRYYDPYRRRVSEAVDSLLAAGRRVAHLSVHSFTPALRGVERQTDLGLLYDPQRAAEREFCRLWQEVLRRTNPELRVRCNYPYRGVSDSLAKTLRNVFDTEAYLGIELEINQKFPAGEPESWRRIQSSLLRSLQDHPLLAAA